MEQLNISSAQNRNILISFLLYLLSIVVLLSSISDIDILLDLNVKIPLFALEISISNFYTFAPVVLLLFHINILYNTHQHFQKLKHHSQDIRPDTIYPYIVNFAFFDGWLVKVFTFIFLIGFAHLTFFYMLISFIPLKIAAILYEYIGLIVIDFIAIGLMFTKHYFFKFVIVLDILLILLLTINPFRDNLELRNIKPVSHKNITLKNLNALKLTRFQAHHLDFLDNNLSKSYITSSTITHSDFQFVDFSDTLIAESNMSQSKYYRVDFSHAKISDSDFSHSQFETIDFSSATLTNVNLCHSSFLKITKDEKTTLENVQCVPQSLLP